MHRLISVQPSLQIPFSKVYSGRSLSFMLLYQAIAGSGILVMSFFLSPFRPPVHAEYDAFHQGNSFVHLSYLKYILYTFLLVYCMNHSSLHFTFHSLHPSNIHLIMHIYLSDKLRAEVNVTTVLGIFRQMLMDFGKVYS